MSCVYVCVCVCVHTYTHMQRENTQGPAQITPFYYKPFYYKIVSTSLCDIPIPHSSTPCDILGEMFHLCYHIHILTLPTTLQQALLLPDPVRHDKETYYKTNFILSSLNVNGCSVS